MKRYKGLIKIEPNINENETEKVIYYYEIYKESTEERNVYYCRWYSKNYILFAGVWLESTPVITTKGIYTSDTLIHENWNYNIIYDKTDKEVFEIFQKMGNATWEKPFTKIDSNRS